MHKISTVSELRALKSAVLQGKAINEFLAAIGPRRFLGLADRYRGMRYHDAFWKLACRTANRLGHTLRRRSGADFFVPNKEQARANVAAASQREY